MFIEMEMEIRKHLRHATESRGIKQMATDGVKNSPSVKYYWSLLAVNWEEADEILLDMIISHWITVRGFSHAGAFMEKYKQKHQKTVEKSKGLRKKLVSENENS